MSAVNFLKLFTCSHLWLPFLYQPQSVGFEEVFNKFVPSTDNISCSYFTIINMLCCFIEKVVYCFNYLLKTFWFHIILSVAILLFLPEPQSLFLVFHNSYMFFHLKETVVGKLDRSHLALCCPTGAQIHCLHIWSYLFCYSHCPTDDRASVLRLQVQPTVNCILLRGGWLVLFN